MYTPKKADSDRHVSFILSGILLFIIILNFTAVSVSAEKNRWMYDDVVNEVSTARKPVDPVFFNIGGDTQYQVNHSIGIPLGEEWELEYSLDKGKRYHIFLVGDWISNDTEPETDYDILTIDPDGRRTWNTESAGLPEQVSSEEGYPYFVPQKSGTHTFRIVNDARDSKNSESAIFMLIEHIDLNKGYSIRLEGRDENDNEVLRSAWAYEFNTRSPQIRVFVDVPDSLDMYEARLYTMANPEGGIGYLINGLGVPIGELFTGFVGGYGGYNATCKGDRNILAMDSGECSGEDLEFVFDTPNSQGDENDIFYYLVLIAEHDEGTIDFFVQTDFTPPTISLAEPLEYGLEDETTELQVSVEDESVIQRVWVEYSADGGEKWYDEELKEYSDVYRGDIRSFSAGDHVDYIVYAENIFGSVGSLESDFQVKKPVSVVCTVGDLSLFGGENLEINGRSSLVSAPLTLMFVSGETVRSQEISTDASGYFRSSFLPPQIGEWSLQALFDGSDSELSAKSNIIDFEVESKETEISSFLSATMIKQNEPLTISGSVIPRVNGVPIEILFVSASSTQTGNVETSADGTFSYTFQSSELGVWNTLAKVGDGLAYMVSQGNIMEFEVVKLTIIDKILIAIGMAISPPYLYGTIGIFGLGLSSIIYVKRDAIASKLPSGLSKKMSKKGGKGKKNKRKNGQRFRRTR